MTSFKGMFLALTGTLVATSLINIGGSGVPFFWILFAAPLGTLALGGKLVTERRSFRHSVTPILLILAVVIALIATTAIQFGMNLGSPFSDLLHLVSRLSFLAYFVVCLYYLDEAVTAEALLWLRRLLIAVCLYGAYQLPAKILGLPLVFDWLRNNHSFSMYGFDSAGWVGLVRATSIYAEPSQAAIPIVLLFILNLECRVGRASKAFGWLAMLLFAALTFSRSVWLALGVTAAAYLAFRWRPLSDRARKHRLTAMTAVIVILLALPFWAFLPMAEHGDISKQARSGSIVLGSDMVHGSPWVGYGWNSFDDVVPDYLSAPIPGASLHFGVIHDTLLSYMEQAGLSGLLLAILPFALIITGSRAAPRVTYSTVAAFLIIAEFGGDIGYMSLVWFWMALLIGAPSVLAAPDRVAANSDRERPYTYEGSRPQRAAS